MHTVRQMDREREREHRTDSLLWLFSFLFDFSFTNNSNSIQWWFVSNKLIRAQHTNTHHSAKNSIKMQSVSICTVRNKSLQNYFVFIFFHFYLHSIRFRSRWCFFYSPFFSVFLSICHLLREKWTKIWTPSSNLNEWERFKRRDCFASKCSLSVCEFENEQYWMNRIV